MNNKEEKIYQLNDSNDSEEYKTKELFIELRKLPIFKKIFKYFRLSSEEKKKLLNYKLSERKKINEVNDGFNPKNVFEVKDFNLWYLNGKKQALFDINLNIKRNKVIALIGPSGCGKSTFLRNLNRMNDEISGLYHNGQIYYDGGINIWSKKMDILELRTQVGMVFQKPTPFAMSIYDNIAYGPRSHGIKNKEILDEIVEQALKDTALWDEVKDELDRLGTDLSGGQQQRLCIARIIAMSPKIILMDEPTSALDPIATSKIEELILKLKNKYTIVIVTHSMAQAQRISDETAFFYKGRLVEFGLTRQIFTRPQNKITNDYILGKMV